MELLNLQLKIKKYLHENFAKDDGAHDLSHFDRVYALSKKMAATHPEANLKILLAAAYFHDFVNLPKNHPDRSKASILAAEKAALILREWNFEEELIEGVKHAIICHSFSANIQPQTIEAKILQDADRLESLGAIGLARVFYISGKMSGSLFHPTDPEAQHRDLDDKKFALDHFHVKLYKLPETFQTEVGRKMANARVALMKKFEQDLLSEIEL